MVELFELIAAKPLEFLAGLGISTTTIYTLVRALKGFIALITKKSTKAKELLQNNNIADAVITKLGGVETFVDTIANVVVNKITNSETIKQFKVILETISKSTNCPVELKAYIQTVLSQNGSEKLALLYEQTKRAMVENTKESVADVIEKGTNALNNNPDTTTQPIQEIIEPITDIVATITTVAKKGKKKVESNNKGDISYA